MNIDLNADVAEGCGQDDKLLTIVSSANVCCGLHAGSYAEMIATLQLAKKNNVRVGAHPCLLYTSPSPRDRQKSRMPSSA